MTKEVFMKKCLSLTKIILIAQNNNNFKRANEAELELKKLCAEMEQIENNKKAVQAIIDGYSKGTPLISYPQIILPNDTPRY